jgi:hypothetical protein
MLTYDEDQVVAARKKLEPHTSHQAMNRWCIGSLRPKVVLVFAYALLLHTLLAYMILQKG